MDAGEHDLRMVLGQSRRFIDEVVGMTRPIAPAGDRGRAEGAVFVAAFLDAQQRARAVLAPAHDAPAFGRQARATLRDPKASPPGITPDTVGNAAIWP